MTIRKNISSPIQLKEQSLYIKFHDLFASVGAASLGASDEEHIIILQAFLGKGEKEDDTINSDNFIYKKRKAIALWVKWARIHGLAFRTKFPMLKYELFLFLIVFSYHIGSKTNVCKTNKWADDKAWRRV